MQHCLNHLQVTSRSIQPFPSHLPPLWTLSTLPTGLSKKCLNGLHSAALYPFTSSVQAYRENEEEEDERETGLTYDETESQGGGQQWPEAVGRNHP